MTAFWRVVAVSLPLCLLVGGGPASSAQDDAGPHPLEEPGPAGAAELIERLGNAWFARDIEGYLALWSFSSPAQRELEAAAAREAFAAEETQLTVLGRPRPAPGGAHLSVDVQVFTATEPRAAIQFWRFLLRQTDGRFALVSREVAGGMDGLIHLRPDEQAYRVRGVSLSLEDFTLLMEDGSLFHTPDTLGPTALVFVGRGRVRFSPRPEGEREQLRQFSGKRELDHDVDWAFVRLSGEDLSSFLDTTRLEPDPHPERRRDEALKRWRERAPRSFIVDAPLPRSPWWLSPAIGDGVVDFPWKGSRVLTYALAASEAEDVNLFERDRQLKICSYPSSGRPPHYTGDDRRSFDVLRHDLVVRFDPHRKLLSAVDTLRVSLSQPQLTLRLKLDDDFAVSSVTADDGRSLLFLRVREQGGLVVSLGPLGGRTGELGITVRYSGRHDPRSMDQELLQIYQEPEPSFADRALLSAPPLVYANRTAWYPRPDNEDFAVLRARLDTPDDSLAVTGGELVATRRGDGRVTSEYRLRQPGKYFTAVVGRLEEVGLREEAGESIRAFADARSEGEARNALGVAHEILAFYAERYGPCPYPRLNIVMAEGVAPGGHSPPGLVYLQRRPLTLGLRPLRDDPANFGDKPDFFLAHELAHQWWGQATAPGHYRDEWLSEAWAQYSAALWVRSRGGEDDFEDILDDMARWARRMDDKGAIHLGQRLGHLEQNPQIQRAIVYDKGAWVIHMLRQRVGDDAFFHAAQAFLQRHRFAKAGTEDLRAALEEASGLDLGPYFEKWIYGTGLPRILWTARTVTTQEGARTTVEVQPEELPGPLPLQISLDARDGRQVKRVELDPSGGSWTIDTPDPPRRVGINEDRGILAETKKVSRLPRDAH